MGGLCVTRLYRVSKVCGSNPSNRNDVLPQFVFRVPVFPELCFFRAETAKINVHIPKNKIIKRRLLVHEDYSNIFQCQTNILTIFRGIFIIFCGISKQLCIYSTISLGTPNDVLWNPGVPRKLVWETLVYAQSSTECNVTSRLLPSSWLLIDHSVIPSARNWT